jgi:hypothetical protein
MKKRNVHSKVKGRNVRSRVDGLKLNFKGGFLKGSQKSSKMGLF